MGLLKTLREEGPFPWRDQAWPTQKREWVREGH